LVFQAGEIAWLQFRCFYRGQDFHLASYLWLEDPAAFRQGFPGSVGWYYESQAAYFREALDGLAYAFREWPIRHLPDDTPAGSDLAPYDIVIWSAPRDAPGYIGAGQAVADYLRDGGRLLLTGQDVGLWDGGGSWSSPQEYYTEYLKARFVADDTPTRVLNGVAQDIYAGATITIAGPGGANNQDYPDVVSVTDLCSFTRTAAAVVCVLARV
jgi:hypothetical protein